jgi:hypothetical protein
VLPVVLSVVLPAAPLPLVVEGEPVEDEPVEDEPVETELVEAEPVESEPPAPEVDDRGLGSESVPAHAARRAPTKVKIHPVRKSWADARITAGSNRSPESGSRARASS